MDSIEREIERERENLSVLVWLFLYFFSKKLKKKTKVAYHTQTYANVRIRPPNWTYANIRNYDYRWEGQSHKKLIFYILDNKRHDTLFAQHCFKIHYKNFLSLGITFNQHWVWYDRDHHSLRWQDPSSSLNGILFDIRW